ncbi:MAG: phosphoribosylamine--glycine ligase [Actinobacteria bacterium]|nr:phosphoribosylamine--glycine ligase [Actinomycetota bacterium]
MRVCVVGSGGREHALALALARTADVIIAPGRVSMARTRQRAGVYLADLDAVGTITTTSVPPEQIEADLFVIGPEVPLVDGLADKLRAQGKLVFGPGADGARLEGSKAWMKEVLHQAGVPTASYVVFDDLEEAKSYIRKAHPPYVVKTDGLAAGKGVLVTESLPEALADVEAKLSGTAFGKAGSRVVIEEGLSGQELSLMVLCDGHDVVPLTPASDFKRVNDGDEGANTGGMGAYSPVLEARADVVEEILEVAVKPVVRELVKRGIDYRGVLYAGLMLTSSGPKIIEYNVRFGDPETQAILPRIKGDLAGLFMEVAKGRLLSSPSFSENACVCVVLAAKGYPGELLPSGQGVPIEGVEIASSLPNVQVLHAGTDVDALGRLVVKGGRVLNVVSVSPTLNEARQQCYRAVSSISWAGMHYRSDIAARACETERAMQG